MTKKTKKRFIAGATCPSCKKLDTLMLYFENNIEKLSCVSCDYQESQTNQEVKQANKNNGNVIGVFKPD